MTLPERVEHTLQNACFVREQESLLLAVSGGVDSMVMLEVMVRLSRGRGWSLTIAHFNHALRGAESEADEAFIREVSERLALPLVVDRAEIGRIHAVKGKSVEMAARDARHRFLSRTAREKRIRKVILAHHAGDQAELFLLRLFRGAGSRGMGGMRPLSSSPISTDCELVRPLLGVSKAEIVGFARGEGVAFREDSSNKDSDILRNRIRNELIPLIEQDYSQSFSDAVTRTMDLLAADHDWVADSAREWMRRGQDRTGFEELALAMQREVIRQGLLDLKVNPDFDLIERLRLEPVESIVMVEGGIRIARDWRGEVSVRSLPLATHREEYCEIDLLDREGDQCFASGVLQWRVFSGESKRVLEYLDSQSECFDADAVGVKIRLRHWLPGDRFQPIGSDGHVKLQDWFTNEKVPVDERRCRVVGESASGVLFWVEGMRISDAFKLTKSTKKVLKITWTRDVKI